MNNVEITTNGMSIQDSKSLILSLNTFAQVEHKTALWFVRTAEDKLLMPVIQAMKLQRTAYYRKFGYIEQPRKFRRGKIDWDKLDLFRPLGQIQLLYGNKELSAAMDIAPSSFAAITSHMGDSPHIIHKQVASSFEFSVQKALLPSSEVSHQLQKELVNFACDAFERLPGSIGYIGFGDMLALGGGSSPYEAENHIPVTLLPEDLKDRIRGVYWGNFLDRQHIELLGGETIASQAPVFLARKLNAGYYLQLTQDINSVTETQAQNLKRFLSPLLPTIRSPRIPKSMLI